MRTFNWILLVALLMSKSAMANDNLSEHVKHVAQALSALYMVVLTDGDEQYAKQVNGYVAQSKDSLQRYIEHDALYATDLMTRWQRLSAQLVVNHSAEYGWMIDSETRRAARSYLSDVYSLLDQYVEIKTGTQHQVTVEPVLLEVITSRYLDMCSTISGISSLSVSDLYKVPYADMIQRFDRLVNQRTKDSDKRTSRTFQQVETKWKFIVNKLVETNKSNAVVAVYFTKNSMAGLLEEWAKS